MFDLTEQTRSIGETEKILGRLEIASRRSPRQSLEPEDVVLRQPDDGLKQCRHSAVSQDPAGFDQTSFVDVKSDVCVIPPNSFALARTVEYFRIPRTVLTICLGKSTYARCGIIVNVTPLEPEWEGHVTLEFSNTTPLPAKIYANEGVAQMLFLESDEACETSYKDRGGKYQGQTGVTLPKA